MRSNCVLTSRSANSASKVLENKLEAGHSESLTSTDILEAARLHTKVVTLDALETVSLNTLLGAVESSRIMVIKTYRIKCTRSSQERIWRVPKGGWSSNLEGPRHG